MKTSSLKDRGRPARMFFQRAGCPRSYGFPFRPAKRSGMALVVTLAIVVLLTFLVVAFFSAATAFRTVENTSAGGVTAGILAQGAAGAVQAELVQEIIAGSTNVTVGTNTFYFPMAATNMLPNRAISVTATDTNFANLVKQSGQPFYAGATIFGTTSSDSTANPGANGRKIGANRWNAPMLTGATFATNQAPNWIYITQNGYTNTISTNVIGRVAFNVYDVGGLLDANVAGFAPKNSGGNPDEMPTKGSALWAVLVALPGITPKAFAATDAWPPQWRITGDWASFASTNSASSLPYYERTGWRTAFLNSTGTASDRMFASRQDLIRYAKAYPGTFTKTGDIFTALQYFTTLSRDRERPTFRPNTSRPKVQQDLASGGNDAKSLDDQINPALDSHPNASGNLAIKKRFPLSRLALVATPVAPAAPVGDPAKIREYFGLTWDSTNNCWTYNQSTPTKILRLSEVPDTREPDFFELLKAAIHVGSLGKQFGFNFPPNYSVTLPSSRLGGDDGRVEDQIVQIAANIIDQADADSYPTRIQFNGRTFYGIEDLPRIYRGREASYRVGTMPNFGLRASDASPTITKNAFLYVTMIHPELWNPHRPSPSPAGPAPTSFRVVAKTFTPIGSEAAYLWNANSTAPVGNANGGYWNNFSARPNGPDCSTRLSYTGGEGSNSPNAAITFNLGSGDASFREPRPLSAVGYPAGSNANGSPTAPDMALTALASPGVPDTVVRIEESAVPPPLHGGNNATYRDALGFVASYAPFINMGAMAKWLNVMKGLGGPVAMELQYQANGQWWTIDKMDVSFANDLRFVHQQAFVAHRADPRSSRWGSLYSLPAGQSDPNPWTAVTQNRYDTGYTANPSSGSFPVALAGTAAQAPGWTGASPGGLLGYLQENLSSSPLRYTDPDGILRGADAKYASGDVGRPMITGNTNSRPVVLNRPFRSVAELGNVFRDTPWRSLDFMSPESADRALLDVFTVSEMPDDGIVAGRINLNTRQAPVIAALIQNAGLVTGANITAAEATAAASKLTAWTSSTDAGKGPLSDRSELVGRFVSGTSFKGPLEEMANQLVAANRPIKVSREAIVRALADAGTTRSWNFLIDIIAQSGQVTPAGVFLPQGESRTWNSVAIDRFSAEVLEQFTETIQE